MPAFKNEELVELFFSLSYELQVADDIQELAHGVLLNTYWLDIANQSLPERVVEILKPDPEFYQRCLKIKNPMTEFGLNNRPADPYNLSTARFSIETAENLIEQRYKLKNKTLEYSDKPIVVYISAQFDPVRAMIGTRISSLVEQNNTVLYFEPNSEDDFYATLQLLENNLPTGQSITLLINGHGSKDYICFGGDWQTSSDIFDTATLFNPNYETSSLDPSDYVDDAEQLTILRRLNIKQVFFLSCSNGEGFDDKDNQANRFAKFLKKGVRVVASPVIMRLKDFLFNSDGSIKGIEAETTRSGSVVLTDDDIIPIEQLYITEGKL
jgi:hypothetical protein